MLRCYAKIWQTSTHIRTKSFSGSLRLWFKKFTLADITVPTKALHEQGQAREDSCVPITYTASPKQHISTKLYAVLAYRAYSACTATAQVQYCASIAASPHTSHGTFHKDFTWKLLPYS